MPDERTPNLTGNRAVGPNRRLELLERIRELGAPEPHLVGGSANRPSASDIRAGRFNVWGHSADLAPPVDWRQDPHGSRSWQFQLNTLTWLKPFLLCYTDTGDRDALAIARDLTVDWVRAHRRSPEGNEFAWYDMAVGLRAPYVAFVLRAGLAEELLPESDAMLLVTAAEHHGAELVADRNYASGHNHGLFQDEGLYLLASQLPVLASAPTWRELALMRLRSTLAATTCLEEGGHLEHSSAYQLAIAGLVSRLVGSVRGMPDLEDLLNRLERTAAWHVTPTGQLAQLGDTDDVPAPTWACGAASDLHGMNALFRTGQAFVRDGQSYLAVSAANHGPAHKHADDTGFLLIENGLALLSDPGRWGYYESDPDRVYARSAMAHNVLTVDGRDFEWQSNAYGSGLEAAGESRGWYAIVVRNPLLARQEVEHRRILVYRPAQALVVIDDVRASKPHEYARHFHFGPEIDVAMDDDGHLLLTGRDTSAILADIGGSSDIELDRGRDTPRRKGWTYPGDRQREPIWSATFRSRASTEVFATTLGLDRHEPPRIGPASVTPTGATVALDGDVSLRIRLEGDRDPEVVLETP